MKQTERGSAPVLAEAAIDLRHVTSASTIYAGQRSLTALSRELARAGASSVLIVTSASLAGQQAHQLLLEACDDLRVTTFEGVRQFSPTNVVSALAAVLDEVSADTIVVLGGGSAMVTARAAAVLVGERRPLQELFTYRDDDGRVVNPRMPRPKLPIWIVPSTPTPAISKAGAALRDFGTGERVAVFDPKARASGIVIDPTIVRSSPALLFIATAMNGLSMGVEGLLATSSDPFAEALLSQGVREIIENLPAVHADAGDWETRARVVMGAILTGQGSDYSGAGLALALSHEIAPHSTVAGGIVESILLPHTVGFALAAVPHRVRVIAQALDADDHTVDGIKTALRAFAARLGLPSRLRDIGIERARLQGALERSVLDWAMNPRMPRRASLGDMESIVAGAW
ncbi:iron-containing alcohol dehydrogenase family protein [bacterium RCC_150]